MDLTFSEEQSALIDLADRILSERCSPETLRSREREAPGSWPRDVWQTLAEAGLVGIGLPDEVGGGGLGFIESALVVEAVARSAAPLPAYATMVLGAAPIAQFGSPEQRLRWLPGVVDASTILTGVLVGANDSDCPVKATQTDRGLELHGSGWYVPFGADADAIVVPASVGDDTVLVIVDNGLPGITQEALAPMSGQPSSLVAFDGVAVDDDAVLTGSIGQADQAVRWLRDRAIAATCVAQVGTCAGALAMTARYVSTREQFGVKLATLQAVSQRAADAWIDTELVRLTAWAATWRLAEGLDATDELDVAKSFAAEAAQRVVAAAQHLHGGIGMDLDYPIHRYFRWAKEHEQRLGGGTAHLAALGERLAGS